MTAIEQSQKVAKLAFAVNERAMLVSADLQRNVTDRDLIAALHRQAQDLACATNELNNISVGMPQPEPSHT